MELNIVTYHAKYDEALHEMENSIVQGKAIRMKIIKKHFIDRARVFKKYHALLAVDSEDKPIATCIGAATKFGINGTYSDAGIGYDVKVSAAYRNKGIARKLARSMYKQFFRPEGFTRNFTTLKQSNIPVIRLLSKTVNNVWLYDFVYLTIPCTTRIKTQLNVVTRITPLLHVTLFKEDEPNEGMYTITKSGLGYFNTYKVYQLQIEGINKIYRMGLWCYKKLNARKYAQLPKAGESMKFATLFNHTPENIIQVNDVLQELEQSGVNYLMVCCRKNDSIYNSLKNISVNTYGYLLVTDFLLTKKDSVSIDVRCL